MHKDTYNTLKVICFRIILKSIAYLDAFITNLKIICFNHDGDTYRNI